MAVQTSYSYENPSGIAGGIYDLAPYEVNSRASEEDAGKIKFGYGVVAGTASNGVKLPASASDDFEGVVVHKAHEEERDGSIVLANGETFGVMRHGRIWARVDADATIVKGEKLYLIVSGDKAGCFTNVSTNAMAIAGKFIGANEDGIAPIVLYNAAN